VHERQTNRAEAGQDQARTGFLDKIKMAKPNYSFEKRRKELEKKNKKEEKKRRKLEGHPDSDTQEGTGVETPSTPG